MTRISTFLGTLAMAFLAFVPSAAFATPIVVTGDPANSTSGLGNFSATLSYTPVNATSGTFTVALKNTSPPANGGFITAFVFNNPYSITAAGLTSSDPDFATIGGPSFNNSINAQPFGDFDIGASTGGAFQGGGMPQRGIAVGVTETFNFALTGTGLPVGGMAEDTFLATLLATLSAPRGDDTNLGSFVVRFRGFEDGGSDKVPGGGNGGPGGAPPIPEPASLLVWSLGAATVAGGAWLRRRRQARAS